MNLDNVPEPDDVTGDWWAATREHRLLVQRCRACAHLQHPPRALCTGCGSMADLEFVPGSGHGTVDACTVVHRAPRPDATAPYVVARVRLAEGPILLTQLHGSDPASWQIGAPVSVAWVDLPDGRALPVFTSPTSSSNRQDS
ncbi:Zn-ribbon domain-containing OB-fold protein [Nocardioides sp. Bht2]|uniref:Zn-ribbon domain-containing OB-fold protein n=1 Tax=Nocardioides sp. Bht2 TaxID=3392297 RepID=UPI0039B5E4CF